MNKLRQNKQFRVAVRTIITALVSFGIAKLTTLNYEWVPLLALIVRIIMKYVNLTYFSDLGVIKE